VCKGVTEVPGRFLVHSGDLIEIDVIECVFNNSSCVVSLCVCKGVTEVPGRFLVHSGDLIEIDIIECVFNNSSCVVSLCVCVCKGVTEVPGRFLVHSGDLIEIDAESLSVVQKVSLFLLSDSLMIALLMPHR